MIVESIRDGSTVLQKIVRNIGLAHGPEELKKFREIGETAIVAIENARKPLLSFVDPNEVYHPARRRKPIGDEVKIKNICEEARITEGPEDIFGEIFDDIDLNNAIDSTSASPNEWNNTLKDVVLARIADPLSKLATSKYIQENFGRSIPVHKIYRMLDRLADADERVRMLVASHTKKVVGDKVDVLFFDVTTLYFESFESDELRRFGFSKDCKFKETQVVLALVTTTDGLPLAYDLYPGNTFEGHTLLPVVKNLKLKYKVNDILLVADRGMFSNENLTQLENEGVRYIVAAKLKSMKKDVKESILQSIEAIRPKQPSDDYVSTDDRDHNGRRLIVSYSEKRAKKDRSDRKRLVDRVKKLESKGKIATADLINNSGTKKFLKISGGFATVDFEKIERDQRWDGLHAVISNVPRSDMAANAIQDRYRGLWQIEESFRINKHSLKMRPIYHWSPRRIRAHILLCFMAYAVLRHTQYRIKTKGLNLGVDVIRNEMNAVQSSMIVDQTTGKRYGIPSKMSAVAKQIYAAFGLMRDLKPFQA